MRLLLALITILCEGIAACAKTQPPKGSPMENVVPKPVSVVREEGSFTLSPATRITVATGNEQALWTGRYLSGMLSRSTGLPLPVSAVSEDAKAANAIRLIVSSRAPDPGPEGYRLEAGPEGAIIRAKDASGLFYGVQTFLQLFPPEVYTPHRVWERKAWSVPAVRIEDRPRFAWRGFLWDPARHHLTKEDTLRLFDGMAMHKLNVFQWHLTDNDGWRLEIKSRPRLTDVGAWRDGIGFGMPASLSDTYDASGRYGGFYTQDDVREVLAYAKARGITIVPEIEMPAHSSAAMVAYPEISCTGGPHKIGEWPGVLCPGREETFRYIEDVLTEVIALFPSEFIHIGGDEADRTPWKTCPKCQERMRTEGLKDEAELQSYLIRRVERFLNGKGRRLIGWDEILEGGLAPNATVMSWRGTEGGIAAAQSGHDVVMSPTSHCYFDYYQAKTGEPEAFGYYLPLSTVYAFEPIPAALPADKRHHILGVQGNVWGEKIANLRYLEYMAYPRTCALSEVAWSPAESRSWEDFVSRMATHTRRLDAAGINYRKLGNDN